MEKTTTQIIFINNNLENSTNQTSIYIIECTQFTMVNVLLIFSFGLSRIRDIVYRIHRGSARTHTLTMLSTRITCIVHSRNSFQRSLIRTNYDIYEQKSSYKIRCYPLSQSSTFATSLQLFSMRSLLEFSHISHFGVQKNGA